MFGPIYCTAMCRVLLYSSFVDALVDSRFCAKKPGFFLSRTTTALVKVIRPARRYTLMRALLFVLTYIQISRDGILQTILWKGKRTGKNLAISHSPELCQVLIVKENRRKHGQMFLLLTGTNVLLTLKRAHNFGCSIV